ncbi:MASE1 domain-containing protein [Paraburkholderia xenovorans]|uniref:MASE1 domain-containing protein n=1 Tax=Paraburkholderia xenovorans TaxID=36873 RepID=UPI0038B868F6
MKITRSAPAPSSFLFWALLYLASGYASHQLNGPVDMTGYIWLPAGVTMAAFMLRPVRYWGVLAIGFALAQLLLSVIERSGYVDALLFAVNEIGCSALAVYIVQRARFSLEGLFFLRGLLAAAALASLLGAIGGGAWFAFVDHASFWRVGAIWAASDFIGIVLVTPVLASWSRFRAHRSGQNELADFLIGLAAFAVMVLIALISFDQDRAGAHDLGIGVVFALTYIPLFCAVVVTLMWGGKGGSFAVLVLALIVSVLMARGHGPFSMVDAHRGRSLLEAQIYLAVASLLVLTISALKTTRDELHDRAAVSQNNMTLALAGASQLSYVLDTSRDRIEWSGDLQRAFGTGSNAEALASVRNVLERLHPDDRARLRSHWQAETDGERPASLPLRVNLPDGEVMTVIDTSASLAHADVGVAVIAGVWQLQREPRVSLGL